MKNKTIAVLGQPGSFHEIAVQTRLLRDEEIVYCSSFGEVVTSVRKGICRRGIIALENSTAGTILPNLTLIRENKLRITDEIFLKVELSLLANPGTRKEDVRIVESHPMAIRQCQDALARLGVKDLMETGDTALAAMKLGMNPLNNKAVIAHEGNAGLYGLEVLERGIESYRKNYTRFVIIETKYKDDPSSNKATISFRISHRPGALADVLTSFKSYYVNMSRIQSIPVPGVPGEFDFYADIEYEFPSLLDKALKEVLEQTLYLSLLGKYKADNTLENIKHEQ